MTKITELERKNLKQNATELRRVAKIMSNLQAVGGQRLFARDTVLELQARLEEVIGDMKSLRIVLNQPLKSKKGSLPVVYLWEK